MAYLSEKDLKEISEDIAIAKRVKERLEFMRKMKKERALYNWSGEEVLMLLEHLHDGRTFNQYDEDGNLVDVGRSK